MQRSSKVAQKDDEPLSPIHAVVPRQHFYMHKTVHDVRFSVWARDTRSARRTLARLVKDHTEWTLIP